MLYYKYFPDKVLHLFDTFEGFDKRDIEKEAGLSDARTGEYSNTSVEMVLKKMPNPDMCRIHKGYFPKSAEGMKESFCFVNLDLDLYEPTYQGLYFFVDKMVSGGMLVHDYFADNFRGPRKAVDQFVDEIKEKMGISLIKVPIGDGISILLAGF